MIKAETKRGDIALEAEGDVVDLTYDLLIIIAAVHNSLPQNMREPFREVLTDAIASPDSPVWKGEATHAQ